MPLETIASACARIVASSTLLWKWFQLFQPIGGVAAIFVACACKGDAGKMQNVAKSTEINPRRKFMKISSPGLINRLKELASKSTGKTLQHDHSVRPTTGYSTC